MEHPRGTNAKLPRCWRGLVVLMALPGMQLLAQEPGGSQPPLREPAPIRETPEVIIRGAPTAPNPVAIPAEQASVTPAPFTAAPGGASGAGGSAGNSATGGAGNVGGTLGLGSNLLGITSSASSGRVSQSDLQFRPYVRTGDILETIPGFIAYQHSGGGKASQFVLRGTFMDHGTDFSLFVDGQPLNLPTHAHGQGYLDFNWVIPELIEGIEYRKGPYYADVGNFSAVGTAAMRMASKLEKGFTKMETGMYGYNRLVTADSMEMFGGHLLYGVEARYQDTAFVPAEKLQRYSSIIKYTLGNEDAGFSISLNNFYSQWRATDQVPEQAITLGLIDRFGTFDPTQGGSTFRHSLNSEAWWRWSPDSITRLNAFATNYQFNLYTNPESFDDLGSAQAQQNESRTIVGTGLTHTFANEVFGRKLTSTVGLQARTDFIPVVQANKTSERVLQERLARNNITESNFALFVAESYQLAEKARLEGGLRWDNFWVSGEDRLQNLNDGDFYSNAVSPKGSLIIGPFEKTEFFVNFGYGLHTNDARGVLGRFDVAGNPLVPTPLINRTLGYEVGARSNYFQDLQSTVSVFALHSNSELIFVGDDATTEPKGAARRYGVDLSNYYFINDWWTVDASFSAVNARFVDPDPDTGGRFVPNSIPFVTQLGTSFRSPSGIFGSLRMRSFSPQPLTSDNTFRSENTVLFNSILGYQKNNFTIGVEWINMFNALAPDISYAYGYRLNAGGPEQFGRVIRPTEPIQARLFVSYVY